MRQMCGNKSFFPCFRTSWQPELVTSLLIVDTFCNLKSLFPFLQTPTTKAANRRDSKVSQFENEWHQQKEKNLEKIRLS